MNREEAYAAHKAAVREKVNAEKMRDKEEDMRKRQHQQKNQYTITEEDENTVDKIVDVLNKINSHKYKYNDFMNFIKNEYNKASAANNGYMMKYTKNLLDSFGTRNAEAWYFHVEQELERRKNEEIQKTEQ